MDPRIDGPVFLGRDDLREQFQNRVLQAADMPLFFIQGQRRVGKSSLISFLPTILDRGFLVVSHDLQDGVPSVQTWLSDLRRAVFHALKKENPPVWQPAEGWLDCWRQFSDELDELAAADGRRLILAIDEYEELHKCLQKDPEQAAILLGAIRAWTQKQRKTVLLFAGADFTSELKNPNWNEFFPQIERLRVDYLGREDSKKLITAVPLRYPPELLDRMFDDTQGHPCLLHKICGDLVGQANLKGTKNIDEADYERSLKRVVFTLDNGVIDLFWGQFCKNRGLKSAVSALVDGQKLPDKRAEILLREHGFIVESNDEKEWRLRVPLFETWVREFRVLD